MTTNKVEVNAGAPIGIDEHASRDDCIRYANSSVLYSQAQVESALVDMARSIEAYYRGIGQRPIIVEVLNGGKKTADGLKKYFTSEFETTCKFDAVHASCYREGESIVD